MCSITVNIDEKVLQDLRPDLDNSAAIRQWVQELIDLHIQQMELEDTETMSLDRRVDSPALSGRGSRPSGRTSG